MILNARVYTVVDILEEMEVAVKTLHPKEAKSVARVRIKTDKRDSAVQTHLLLTVKLRKIKSIYLLLLILTA